MSKKYRNPATGEIFTLEEEDEEVASTPAKKAAPSAEPETPAAEEDEPADEESEENAGKTKSKDKSGFIWTPFDALDEIDGKDVEKIALGAVIGIGGVLAIKGLCSFFSRD